jgi:lipoic acid synthetase
VINNRETPVHHLRIQRKPDWLRARVPGGEGYERLKAIIDEHKLHTVCQEASCPNMGECWGRGTATIMILGDVCTRACGFCNIKTGKPPVLDLDEPRRVAESLKLMKLKHVVITSVNRDELADGGAAVWAETVRRVHDACPDMSVEILVGDFQGDEKAIQAVCDARPEIISHNMETVRRMHPAVRPQAKYERSLAVLRQFKQSGLVTKTGIMVGIGEHDDEVLGLLDEHGESLADRTTAPGHLTGSAVVVDAAGERVLVLLHTKLQRWLQPGGHADGDHELAGVALREATEETGIEGLEVVLPAVDLDVHEVDHGDALGNHLHLDLRFVVLAPNGSVPEGNHESEALRWVDLDELRALADETGVLRLAAQGAAALSEIMAD